MLAACDNPYCFVIDQIRAERMAFYKLVVMATDLGLKSYLMKTLFCNAIKI